MPDGVYAVTYTCECTVWGCGNFCKVQVLQQGSTDDMMRAARAALRATGWGTDRMGVLCADHLDSHRVGHIT